MIKNILLAFLYLLAGSQFLAAQADDSENPRQPRGKKAYFVCTSFPKGFKNPITVRTGKKIQQVELSKRSASDPIKLTASGIVEVVELKENPAEGEDPYQVIAKAVVKTTSKDSLIILSPAEAKKTGSTQVYSTSVQDLTKFKGGDYLYINLSPTEIVVKLGDKKLRVKPRSSKIYDAKNLKKAVNVATSYGYLDKGSKQWKLLSASTVVLRPTRREICVFGWNKKFNRVSYHGITFTEAVE